VVDFLFKMKLIDVLKDLNSLNPEAVIYAKEPWSEFVGTVNLIPFVETHKHWDKATSLDFNLSLLG
jgi:hypothetical protein